MVEFFENIALISLSVVSIIISIYIGINLIKDIIKDIIKTVKRDKYE